ncbi:hypothetical protein N219_07945 [Limosilactobacillus fermentum MTCC 8711]|nr:hypothetical protein N219_07945 [Limosilactobacillus fermentum MTCC 8711]
MRKKLISEVEGMTHYKIGDKVAAKKFGPLEHDFSGEVEKVYDNSVMIAITEYDPADQSGINELNGRAVVRKGEAKILKEVPRTKEDLEAAAKEEEEAAAKAAKLGKNTRRRRTKTTKESSSSEKNEKSSK